MQIRNTKEAYGLIAILLHWIIAVGFLGAYIAVYYRHWFTEDKTPENWTALQLHLSFGVTIGTFVLLRVIWRAMNPAPVELGKTELERLAARVVHWTLYAVMMVMPFTGYLGTGAATEWFFLFEIPKFQDTALYSAVVTDWLRLTWEEFEAPIDLVHKTSGAWFVWVLITVHIVAALYHHFARRDEVLRRMLGKAQA